MLQQLVCEQNNKPLKAVCLTVRGLAPDVTLWAYSNYATVVLGGTHNPAIYINCGDFEMATTINIHYVKRALNHVKLSTAIHYNPFNCLNTL